MWGPPTWQHPHTLAAAQPFSSFLGSAEWPVSLDDDKAANHDSPTCTGGAGRLRVQPSRRRPSFHLGPS